MLSNVGSRGRIVAVWCALLIALVEPAAAEAALPTPAAKEWSCKGIGHCSIGPVAVSGNCRLTVRSKGIAAADWVLNGRQIGRLSFSGIRVISLAGVVGMLSVRVDAFAQGQVEGALSCGR